VPVRRPVATPALPDATVYRAREKARRQPPAGSSQPTWSRG